MLNRILLQGRFTATPELKRTNSGMEVTSFTLAVDNGRDKSTDFVRCVAWRKTAEHICKYFEKGQMAIVVGALHSRAWEDKNGAKHTEWEVTADSIEFCGSKREQQTEQHFDEVDDEGEIPF